MSYTIKEILLTVGLAGFLILVLVVSIVVVLATVPIEQEIVEGEVVDVVSYDNYMELFMKDGSSYKIRYPGDNIDLTVNSRIIMRLTEIGCLWFHDDIWDDVSITKVPGD